MCLFKSFSTGSVSVWVLALTQDAFGGTRVSRLGVCKTDQQLLNFLDYSWVYLVLAWSVCVVYVAR